MNVQLYFKRRLRSLLVNKIDRPNTTPTGVIIDFQILALTSISFNDLLLLFERMGGSLDVSLSTG